MGTITASTTREAKHWYVMFAYVIIGYGGLAWGGYQLATGNGLLAGSALAITAVALALGGVWTLAKLFRDAMHLRRHNRGWRPAWTRYIGVAVGVPVLAFVVGDQLDVSQAGMVAFYLYVLGTVGANTVYLWRRHKFIGRP